MTCDCVACRLGRKALEEVDKASAVAASAMAEVEESTNGMIDRAQEKLSVFNQKAIECKNGMLDTVNGAIEAVEADLKKIGAELKEMGEDAFQEVFSIINAFPDEFNAKLSGAKNEVMKRIRGTVEKIGLALNGKLDALRGETEARKAQVLGRLGENMESLGSEFIGMTGEIRGKLANIIEKVKEGFGSACTGKDGLEEGLREMERLSAELSEGFQKALDDIDSGIGNSVRSIRARMESAVNGTFAILSKHLDVIPPRVEAVANGITGNVDEAMQRTLDQASKLMNDLVRNTKDRLREAVSIVTDIVDRMTADGIAVVKELRDEIAEALDMLIDRIGEFTGETLEGVRRGAREIIRSVKDEVNNGIASAREAVNEMVTDMGNRMNQQIEKLKNDLTGEAEKQARQMRVMGEEAYAEAEEAFVNAGYAEDVSVIPDIRASGEEAISEIQRTMDEQSDDLIREFQAEAELYIPRITGQGAKIVGQARGAGVDVIAQCVKIGMSLATTISKKADDFQETFEELSSGVMETLDGKGKEHADMCLTSFREASEKIGSSGEDFLRTAREVTVTLLRDTRERFERLEASFGSEVEDLVDDILGPVKETVEDTCSSFAALSEGVVDELSGLVSDMKGSLGSLSGELDDAITEELEKLRNGSDDALEGAARIKDGLLGRIKERSNSVLGELRSGCDGTLELPEAPGELMGNVQGRLDELTMRMNEKCDGSAASLDDMIGSAGEEVSGDVKNATEGFDSGMGNVLDGRGIRERAEALNRELASNMAQTSGIKGEIGKLRDSAKKGMDDISAESDEASAKAKETGKNSARKAFAGASKAGDAIKDAGSSMTEKLSEAVAVVRAAGDAGKAGMEAARAAGKPGGTTSPSAKESPPKEIDEGGGTGTGTETEDSDAEGSPGEHSSDTSSPAEVLEKDEPDVPVPNTEDAAVEIPGVEGGGADIPGSGQEVRADAMGEIEAESPEIQGLGTDDEPPLIPEEPDDTPDVPGPEAEAGSPVAAGTDEVTPGIPEKPDDAPDIPGPEAEAGSPVTAGTDEVTPEIPEKPDDAPGIPEPETEVDTPGTKEISKDSPEAREPGVEGDPDGYDLAAVGDEKGDDGASGNGSDPASIIGKTRKKK